MDNGGLLRFVQAYRTHGHRGANLDPLDIMQREWVSKASSGQVAVKNQTVLFKYYVLERSWRWILNVMVWQTTKSRTTWLVWTLFDVALLLSKKVVSGQTNLNKYSKKVSFTSIRASTTSLQRKRLTLGPFCTTFKQHIAVVSHMNLCTFQWVEF